MSAERQSPDCEAGEGESGDCDFEVAVTRLDPLTVTVGGPLDFDTADELLETVARALDGPRAAPLLALDLARVTLCDSMGLSALLSLRRRTTADGVRLMLLRRPPLLDRLLELTGTTEYLVGTAAGEDEHSEP